MTEPIDPLKKLPVGTYRIPRPISPTIGRSSSNTESSSSPALRPRSSREPS